MAKGNKVCKVCGKEYVYCRTNRPSGLFRWQDVACSPEHGAIYFAQIAASRAEQPARGEQADVSDGAASAQESTAAGSGKAAMASRRK